MLAWTCREMDFTGMLSSYASERTSRGGRVAQEKGPNGKKPSHVVSSPPFCARRGRMQRHPNATKSPCREKQEDGRSFFRSPVGDGICLEVASSTERGR